MLAVLALDSAGGLLFGWLFVRRGLAAAMLAHGAADIALLVLGPLTR